jgi:DNA-binding PadR family transcriptional regulator
MADQSRLPNAALHILVAVGEEPLHGYGIMLAIESMTAGEVRMGPGTLYTTIKKLLASEMLEEVQTTDSERDERRRYYRATPNGRAYAATELRRLHALVEQGRRTGLLADR